MIGNLHVGCFGEIDPIISDKFELRVPISGAEFSLRQLSSALSDPV